MANYDSIGVVGSGSWGTTIAHLLGKHGQKILLWCKDRETFDDIQQNRRNSKYTYDFPLSEKIQPVIDLESVGHRCEIIIIAVPSQDFRETAYRLGNYLRGDQILISACQGLEASSYCLMSKILREETCVKKIGVLSGPNLFQEILKGSPSAAVIGSNYHEVIHKSIQLFSSQDFKLYGSEDVPGVELSGIIKNVIAIGAGISDGVGFGYNTKALLITRGISEMARIGIQFGAKPITFTGLSGIGDLIVTCSSKLSHNYRVGYYLAQGQSLSQILRELGAMAEGVNTAKVLHEFSKRYNIIAPIIEGVYSILYENCPIAQVVNDLMSRMAQFEFDPTMYFELKKEKAIEKA